MIPLQVARFAIVGMAATAVHFTVGLCVAQLLGAAPLTANAVAFATALAVSYLSHSVWTFQAKAARPDAFARFVVVAIVAFGANQAIVYGLTKGFGWTYAASLVVVLAIVPALTFLASRSWAFATKTSL